MASSSSSSSTGHPQPPMWARHLIQLDNPHPSPLSGTDDLLSRFHLAPVYDTFLRPYLPQSHNPQPALPPSLDPHLALASATAGPPAPAPPPAVAGAGAPAATAAPAPASPSPAPQGGGLKITLGGIKFGAMGGSGTSAGGDSADGPLGAADGTKKRKRARMDKTFEHMVGDVLGRISHPRTSSSQPPNPSTSLLHLVSNPDPTPCPPLHPLDAHQVRDALTLRAGALAGFDMGVWEVRSGVGGQGGAGGERRKKKKRKHDDAHGGADAKKQRR
ncbi:hypothetical protein JCM3775_002207 [Rhodotorula graminis]